MSHLSSSFKGKNHFWRYIVMIVVIMIATNTIGSLPIGIAGLVASGYDPETFSEISTDLNRLTTMGMSKNTLLVFMLIPFIVGVATYALLIRPMHGRSFYETITGSMKFRWNRMLSAGSVWMIISVVYLFVYLGLDPGNFSINNKSASLIMLVFLSFLLIPFQAAFEEILFRGYLMQGFTAMIPRPLFPLAGTAIIFALMHSLNPEVDEFGFFTVMPQYLTFGIIFGIAAIMDDGIETALGAHAANNIFLCIMVTHGSSALQTDALFEQHQYSPWLEFAGLVVSGIIFLIVMKKIYRWESFSVLMKKVAGSEEIQTP